MLITWLAGMDWAALGKDALVVDVGGGQGSQSLTLSKHCPNLKLIVQDRETIRGAAKEVRRCTSLPFLNVILTDQLVQFWEKENPEAWNSGRASFQGLCYAATAECAVVILIFTQCTTSLAPKTSKTQMSSSVRSATEHTDPLYTKADALISPRDSSRLPGQRLHQHPPPPSRCCKADNSAHRRRQHYGIRMRRSQCCHDSRRHAAAAARTTASELGRGEQHSVSVRHPCEQFPSTGGRCCWRLNNNGFCR